MCLKILPVTLVQSFVTKPVFDVLCTWFSRRRCNFDSHIEDIMFSRTENALFLYKSQKQKIWDMRFFLIFRECIYFKDWAYVSLDITSHACPIICHRAGFWRFMHFCATLQYFSYTYWGYNFQSDGKCVILVSISKTKNMRYAFFLNFPRMYPF